MNTAIAAYASAIVMVVGSLWYIWLIFQKKVEPLLASWIVSAGTLCLSFATYWTTPNHSLFGNIANLAATVSAVLVLAVLGILNWKRGIKPSFTSFQKTSLKISLAIVILWVIIVWVLKKTGFIPNICTQALMLISYWMLYQKLWAANKKFDSFVIWGAIYLSSLIGVYVAGEKGEGLSVLYAVRAALTTAIVIWLMYRVLHRERSATT